MPFCTFYRSHRIGSRWYRPGVVYFVSRYVSKKVRFNIRLLFSECDSDGNKTNIDRIFKRMDKKKRELHSWRNW